MAKKNQASQANKLKREERLNEIDGLLQNNKELQEQIMQKLDESRALSATAEVGQGCENKPATGAFHRLFEYCAGYSEC